jgi:mannose-6-phosphate isomerase-like protein (cupin superfamily)
MKTQRAVSVTSGADRSGEDLRIWGLIPLQVKVSTADTDGALFLFEHADMDPGGPPRHFHHEQDEWFYVVDGEFDFEVGDDAFSLRPGDSLLAPRLVPHVWACVSEKGTLLLGVQPAGSLEEFFRATCEMAAPPSMEETARLFAAHGMEVVGPPLGI